MSYIFVASDNDYDYFVDTEKYRSFNSRVCHEDQAFAFLQNERRYFLTMKKIAEKQPFCSCMLADASMQLYLATEIALHQNTVEVGYEKKLNCLQRVSQDCYQTSKSVELRCISSCPTVLTSYYVEKKAGIAIIALFFRSQIKDKKV